MGWLELKANAFMDFQVCKKIRVLLKKNNGPMFYSFFFYNFFLGYIDLLPQIGHLLKTIEDQGTLLSVKEEELSTSEKARETNEALIDHLKGTVSAKVT